MADDNRIDPVAHERDRYLAATAGGQSLGQRGKSKSEIAEQDRKDAIATEAMERWRLFEGTDEVAQRAQELDDLKFDRARLEDHWPEDQLHDRKGGMINGVAIGARPCLVIPKLTQPVQQVINEGRQARISPVVKAKPGTANEKDAEVRQGILRAIEVDSGAPVARMWGFSRAVKCGRGYWRVETKFANDGDHQLDIVISRIKNGGAVYVDPFHVEPDASDAEFWFITEDLPHDEFARRHKDHADIVEKIKAGGDEFTSLTDKAKNWVSAKTVRVAEYFYIEHTPKWLVEGEDQARDAQPTAEELAALGPLPTFHPRRVRKIDHRDVRWCLLGPGRVLDEAKWPGRYIPLVQVIGREFNVDGVSTYKGLATDSKDAQRVYNYAVSTEVETAALAPRSTFIAAAGQIEKYKQIWALANQRNFSHLPYDPLAVGGVLAPAPQRQFTDVSALQPMAMLVQQADQDIKATTGRFDASLGNVNPQERSGKALRELKQQGELGASDFIESFAAAIRHEGRIVLDLLKYVYVEPGRIARMLGDEPGDERAVMLNAPFVRDDEGQPQPAPTGAMAWVKKKAAAALGKPLPEPEVYDITKGEFGLVVDVGPSYRTQREENVAFLQSMIEADPNLAPILGAIMAEEMGGPMGRKVAKLLRKINPQIADDGEEQSPEAMAGHIAELEKQVQEMGQALQQAQQAVETQQARQQATVQVAQMRVQADLQKAAQQAEAQFAAARMTIEADMAKVRAVIQGDAALAEFDAAMTLALQNDEQNHERQMAQLHAAIQRAAVDQSEQHETGREFRGAARDEGREHREADRADMVRHEDREDAARAQSDAG